MICCSTWGEGEQPDNAEDLWISANAEDSPSMEGVNFSVLALGDTSYELFCESGKEWDSWLESKGGFRVYQRVDCDVDYEAPAKEWMDETLARMGAVDDSGTFQESLVEEIKNQASGSASTTVSSESNGSDSSIEISTDGDRSMTILLVLNQEMLKASQQSSLSKLNHMVWMLKLLIWMVLIYPRYHQKEGLDHMFHMG